MEQVTPSFIGMQVQKQMRLEIRHGAEVGQGGVDADDPAMFGGHFCKPQYITLARIMKLNAQRREGLLLPWFPGCDVGD